MEAGWPLTTGQLSSILDELVATGLPVVDAFVTDRSDTTCIRDAVEKRPLS